MKAFVGERRMPSPTADLLSVIARHWGFASLRPLQQPAMQAVLDGRDSLVVLPTGAGKSLCYQAPAVAMGGTTVVISPLIALMKDQVDGLRACGVAAAQLDSAMTGNAKSAVEADLRKGRIRLLFVSPERLIQTDLYRTLADVGVRRFAIDEAHCISHWGHDFRPEYRMLGRLREHFPDASLHAYTATATEQVRRDIIRQLALRDPEVLVGDFDRPNLTYRVWPRHDVLRQVLEVTERHPGEAGIIYCMRRADVDSLAADLRDRKVNARPYHAGLTDEERHATQEEFASERCDIVVATIAFGMGIDRSNVRFVLHTAMPKSIEHYQQETGRAGRDGLEAECVLLYSGGDVPRMKAIIEKSAESAEDRSFLPGVFKHLDDMDRYARGAVCRHKALVEYFGQEYSKPTCEACDLCLGDSELVPEADLVAQKILSCVARVRQMFGLTHVLDILRGKNNEKVKSRGHDRLTTHGLLKEHSDSEVRDWIYQLIGQEVLVQTEDEYPKLMLNDASWEVMRGQRSVRLVRLVRRKKGEKPQRSQTAVESWEGVDQGLFEALKGLRRQLAAERQVPPYIIFSDTTLRELSRVRPRSPEAMRLVYGVGEAKLRDFGGKFLEAIADYCAKNDLPRDVKAERPRQDELPGLADGPARTRQTPRQQELFALFREGLAVEDVMHRTGLARRTVSDYLAGYVRLERPASLDPWVDEETYHRVVAAVRQVGGDRLKPIFLALGEKVPYDLIRLVAAHVQGE
jgi:ATP-dependent DNA helicase RecQ